MHCGNQLPDPVTVKSSGYQMLVRLKTDGSAAGKGFKAHYARVRYSVSNTRHTYENNNLKAKNIKFNINFIRDVVLD